MRIRSAGLVLVFAGIAAITASCTSASSSEPGGAASNASGSPVSSPVGGSSTAAGSPEPQTAAGARAAAQQFYDLFAAGQFAAAWLMLTPYDRHAVDQSTYVAVDEGCPSASAGLARDIKRVTVVGNTAIVVESVAGVLSSIGTVTDTFVYSNGQWSYSYPPSVLAVYQHGSVSADIAAARSAGYCAH